MIPTITDVSPRDGLQSEDLTFDTRTRSDLVRSLVDCGLTRIEAVSFVDPRRVPAMSGAEEIVTLVRGIEARIVGLVLNWRGFERAVRTDISHINVVLPCTDTFGTRNQGARVDEALSLVARIQQERSNEKPIIASLAVAFGCPFEGVVPARCVLDLVEQLAALQVSEITLADTIGVAGPTEIRKLVESATRLGVPVGIHLHDTRNTAIAGIIAALEAGAVNIDSSLGGIGGCPFAPNSTGNVATEDVVYILEREGVNTGIDLDGLIRLAQWLSRLLGRSLPGRVSRAGSR